MEITIAAKYLKLLDAFRAKNDVRYYLNGILIEPREKGGAFLVATNGHMLVAVCDESAKADQLAIVKPDKLIIAQSGKAERAFFDGKLCTLWCEEECTNEVCSAPAPFIDAKYPDWKAVIPAKMAEQVAAPINAKYLAAFAKAPFSKGPGGNAVTIYAQQDATSVVRLPSLPEIVGLIMPMREITKLPPRPEWL